MVHEISAQHVSIEQIKEILNSNKKLKLSTDAVGRINKCRAYIDQKMQSQKEPIYGINTGFGSLCNTSIDNDSLEQLQTNLVMSHACGMGEEVPHEVVKLMLLLKIQGLSYGNSGVQLQTVERLIDFYNNNILPVIYQQGSLGASGDLSPLAHMCLPMLGLGEVDFNGKRIGGAELLKQMNWSPIRLKSKEGLALLNGTQFMSAYGVHCILQAQSIMNWSNTTAAISLEGFDGRIEPFKECLHTIRPHAGQLAVSKFMREALEGSEIIKQPKAHVQDPYSFRCVPQVHGASYDTIKYVEQVITTEINSVTDNPTVFVDGDEILSGGNFHGQPLALALDFLAIALHELGNISERRTYQLISGLRGLPAFLVSNPGLNSGFMIPQYTAASIVSQNKQLCTPASIDSIVSSNGQEDHVSMGSNAATKCYKVVENVWSILAIELFNASQAIEFRRPLKSSDKIECILKEYRTKVPKVTNDKIMYLEMQKSKTFLKEYF